VSCVTAAADQCVAARLIDTNARGRFVRAAAQSN
jgi:hypothetical protein